MKVWPEPEIVTLPAGGQLFHVHRPAHRATAFNPHAVGMPEWRFSPFPDAAGNPIGSWYGAISAEGALYETVFRDVVISGRPVIDRNVHVAGRALSRVGLQQDLDLVRLFGDGLMRLGADTSLTSGDAEMYGKCRQVARELHDQFATVHGLIWRSRINNDELSLVLYADRVSEGFASALETLALEDRPGMVLVMKAANRIGCAVT